MKKLFYLPSEKDLYFHNLPSNEGFLRKAFRKGKYAFVGLCVAGLMMLPSYTVSASDSGTPQKPAKPLVISSASYMEKTHDITFSWSGDENCPENYIGRNIYRREGPESGWSLISPSPANGRFTDCISEHIEYEYKMLPVCSTNGDARECETADCAGWKVKIKAVPNKGLYIDISVERPTRLEIMVK